jgi:hypothetical protein
MLIIRVGLPDFETGCEELRSGPAADIEMLPLWGQENDVALPCERSESKILRRARRVGDIMKTSQVFVLLGWLLASGVVSDVKAADLQYDSRARVVTRSAGCGWRYTCCPDRYSCSSLYGAYGPYGGAAYWSRYTYGGWAYIR